jgi:hypothetical protein
MRLALLVLMSGSFTASPFAQTANPVQKPTLESRLASVAYALSVDDGKMTGPGASVLQTAISHSDYVLLGEDHLTREIPRLAAAVCQEMGSHGGLSAMAFEVSPAAAEFVQASLEASNRIGRMAELQKRYPNSVAFLNMVEENDLAARCAAVSHRNSFQIWGLDQDFWGSSGWTLDRMLETRPGPTARAETLRLQTMEKLDAEEARKTGDPSKLFLLAAPDSETEQARAAIETDGTPATRSMLQELLESREIYREFEAEPHDANARRAQLLKENFLHDYEAARGQDKPQRVLFKFGDWHLYKGINPLHQRDLGNFIAEFADGQDRTSLHILVLGARGTHALFSGYDRPLKLEAFVMDEDEDYRWLRPAINVQRIGSWTLFDLRRLRFTQPGLDADWQRVIYGYDLLVLIPELTPAA